jgi:ADP-ribosyl-[dinitrogen reductase] hydrolase
MSAISLRDRYEGALLGLACGDAIGTTVEFLPRGSFTPVRGMSGGGPFSLYPGQWTDDTSMALCLAESLIAKGGFDPRDQMGRYLNWWRWGYLSSTGNCFDIGMTTKAALARFETTGEPFAGTVDPNDAGNGSLMRLAPVVLYFHPDRLKVLEFAAASSRTTHGAPEAVDCCRLLAIAIANALSGVPKSQLLEGSTLIVTERKVRDMAHGDYAKKSHAEIRGTGYSVQSLEASLWCLATTHSFKDAVLAAANLGDDADTTAAITGQIAGAHYGANSIPEEWIACLHMGQEIRNFAGLLYEAATASTSH